MNEVSHLATDKDIVTMLTAIIGAICLVIGGTIGFFTKYFYENKKINESKKALRQQMITNNIAPMRQAWINDVREKASLFLANAGAIQDHMEYIEELKKNHTKEEYAVLERRFFEKIDKNDELYVQLKLLLPFENGDNKEELAVNTMNSLKIVYDTIGFNNQTKEEIIENNK